jgi:hypothetical protein
MAEKIQNERTKETNGQTDASVLNAIRYLDSPTDYRELLTDALQPTSFQKVGFNMPDEGLSIAWGRLLNLSLIALLVCMILLLSPRS